MRLTCAIAVTVCGFGLSIAMADEQAKLWGATTGNLLRNGGFELGSEFNGASMRIGTEFLLNILAGQGKCRRLPAEGWWTEGDCLEGASVVEGEAHAGDKALVVETPAGKKGAARSAPEIAVPVGPVTLSAWVRTSNAKGELEVEFVATGARKDENPRSLGRKSVPVPEGAQEWSRVSVTADAPSSAAAVVRVRGEAGRIVVDNVQLESGGSPTAFDVRVEERLRVCFKGVAEERLPIWREKDGDSRKLLIRNDSQVAITGSLEVWIGSCSNPKSEKVASVEEVEIDPGDVETVRLRLDHLAPGAYALAIVLHRDGNVALDSSRFVDAAAPIGGTNSNSMLKARAALRFAIAPAIAPAKIFGVGNGMLGYGWKDMSGSWFGGWPLALFETACGEGFVCGRGQCGRDDEAFLFAAAGVPLHRMENVNAVGGAPEGALFQPPGVKGGIDFWNPDGMAFLKEKAAAISKANAENPLIVSYQMANESPFPFKDGLCATAAADAHFRTWCEKRHGDLGTLNRRWGTTYADWSEVEQPASVRYAEELKNRPKKEGAAAIDWLASLGNLTPEVHARMMAVPGRGMDWMRWRTWSSLWMYETFRAEAKRHDDKTLYSTNLCWPDFWPQMSMPFFRRMDVAMLDCQYTSGLPRGLGNPMEMMEILEMAESCANGKPVWGIEIYVQPQWPAAFAALQNWGVAAHGMTNNLVFAWGPYSDHGVPKEVRAWEKPDAVPMWMLIDLDGTKLPAYHTNQKSLKEIHEFHKRHDALTLNRVATDIAFYVSEDTSEYISLETANKPWGSSWTRTRNNLSYLLRMNGVTADFVDGETLPEKPGVFNVVVVPASYALSQEAAERLAGFAARGGTVVLAGPCGIVDPWLKPYENVGGPAWKELGWRAKGGKLEAAAVDFVGAGLAAAKDGENKNGPINEAAVFKKIDMEPLPDAEALKDTAGAVVGWARAWGKGRLVAYTVLPDSYTGNPHPSLNHMAWMRHLVKVGGVKRTGGWRSSGVATTAGAHGEGSPVVEVVVRVRKGEGAKEKFVFMLNEGGAGEGTVEIPVAEGVTEWKIVDVIHPEATLSPTVRGGALEIAMRLLPWEYRVLRMTGDPHAK